MSNRFKTNLERYSKPEPSPAFDSKKSVDQIAIYSKIREKDPIFGSQHGSPPLRSKYSGNPREWEYSPRNNVTHEAVNFCTKNELEQRSNMNILSNKEPIYSYQKLDHFIREDKISKVRSRRLIKMTQREKLGNYSPNDEVETLLKNDIFLKYKNTYKPSVNATYANSRSNSRERTGLSNFTIPIESKNTYTLTGRRKLIKEI